MQELKYEQTWTVHNLRIFIIVYSLYITLEVSFRGRGSINSTVHCTVPYRSHSCRTRALTLRLCFCCLKVNWFHGYKTGSSPFDAWRPIQFQTRGIDLYTSANFRAFNTDLMFYALFFCTKMYIWIHDKYSPTSFKQRLWHRKTLSNITELIQGKAPWGRGWK